MPAKKAKLIPAKQKARILSVTVRRLIDESPDTSYLGEYSNSAKTEYAIDRKHSLDCNAQTYNHDAQAEDWLERIYRRIPEVVCTEHINSDDPDCAMCKAESERVEAEQLLTDLKEGLDDCSCDESSGWSPRELRYFNPPVENYKGEPHADIVKYILQDYDRMESLNAGNWCFIGIRAECEVGVPTQYTGQHDVIYTEQTLTSGGLWGIESDSDDSYLKQTEDEQIDELRDVLKNFVLSKRAIATAFKNVERRDS